MDNSESPLGQIDPVVRGLLPGYLERRDAELVTFNALLASEDFDQIRTMGHNLSGSGGAYGLQELTEIGRRIETAAKERDGNALGNEFERLALFLQSVKAEVA